MSVLVKGMDMPSSCGDCQFRKRFGYDDEIDCTLIKGAFMAYPESHERRHKDCPLVEVKTPHGDLIDRDALDEAVSNFDWGQDSYWCENASDLVNEAPTVIEAED